MYNALKINVYIVLMDNSTNYVLWDGSPKAFNFIKDNITSRIHLEDDILVIVRKDRVLYVNKFSWVVKNELGLVYVCDKDHIEYLCSKWSK